MRIAFYPGTFDPITRGHLDIITRAVRLFDKVVVGVAENKEKRPLFTLEERVDLIKNELKTHPDRDRIEVVGFNGLLTQAVKKANAATVVRGLRSGTDFDFESQLTHVVTRLAPEVETVFFMASEAERSTTSSVVKEIARLDGDISVFLSPATAQALLRKVNKNPT